MCDNLYEAPGNILDWMYSRAGIKYSYAVHLRDTGTYGFSLPAKYIRPVGEETAGMLHYLGKFIAAKYDRECLSFGWCSLADPDYRQAMKWRAFVCTCTGICVCFLFAFEMPSFSFPTRALSCCVVLRRTWNHQLVSKRLCSSQGPAATSPQSPAF